MNAWWNRKRERLDGIYDLLAYAPGASILDLGCNRGLVGYEFANKGAELVHGCDISEKAIETARALFVDVTNCESRFDVLDLSRPAALGSFGSYDIILMLGVYHKIKRLVTQDAMSGLMQEIAIRTKKYFAWNGYQEEEQQIDASFAGLGLFCIHRSTVYGQPTAIWKRL